MAVGAGSIKRAAKAKVEPAENKTETKVTDTKADENKVTANKTTEKTKTDVKKTVAKKTTSAKKTVEKPQEKVVENIEPEVKAVKKEINQVCHLTEELPIHLL